MTTESSTASTSEAQLTLLVARCTFPPPGTVARCALSGGADSAALVALAVRAGLDVTAVHVDHGIRADSAADADIAADIAATLAVAFECIRVTVTDGPNLEARARAARRSVLGAGALTGHTADDQAETLLLSLLRGAGARGLAAMRPGPSKPILALRRAETHRICRLLDLSVATDPSNTDPRFRRNRVRHEVVPLLDEISERDTAHLFSRTSSLLRDDDDLLDELSGDLDPTDARALAEAPPPLARRAVRRWLVATIDGASEHDSDSHPPDSATVERVMAVARGTAAACDVSGGWRVERSKQRLRLFFADGSSG